MAEKKVATKKTTAKAAPKKAAPKTAAKKATLVINGESVGFRAGDVYQTLAAAANAMSVADIAKKAKISAEETLLGIGWLFKEGKVKDENGLIALA